MYPRRGESPGIGRVDEQEPPLATFRSMSGSMYCARAAPAPAVISGALRAGRLVLQAAERLVCLALPGSGSPCPEPGIGQVAAGIGELLFE